MALLEALGGFGQGFSGSFPDTFKTILQNALARRRQLEQSNLEGLLQGQLQGEGIRQRGTNEMAQLVKAEELKRQTLREQPKTLEQVAAPLVEIRAGGGTLTPAQQQVVDEFFASRGSPLDKIYANLGLGTQAPGGTGIGGAGVGGESPQIPAKGILERVKGVITPESPNTLQGPVPPTPANPGTPQYTAQMIVKAKQLFPQLTRDDLLAIKEKLDQGVPWEQIESRLGALK